MKIEITVDLEIFDKLDRARKTDFLIAIVEDARDKSGRKIMANVEKRWTKLGLEYIARCGDLEDAIRNENLRRKVDDVLGSIMEMFNVIIPFPFDISETGEKRG